MATGFVTDGEMIVGPAYVTVSTNLDNGLTVPFIGAPPLSGEFTDPPLSGARTVVNPAFALATKTGVLVQTFEENWYNRVHVIPSRYDVGNLISDQVRTFEVWNAYFTSKSLSAITQSGTQGLSLTRPAGAPSEPATYDPLEALTYSISITLTGPATINALYGFTFPAEAPSINVVGNRVVFFPFSAQAPVEEFLEFDTEIMESYDGHEQRVQVRERPRQTLGMNYLLSDAQEVAVLKNILIGNAGRLFGVPMWQESRPLLANVSIGATSITVTTTNADFRVGLVALWRSFNDFEVVEVSTVSAGSLTLALGTSKAHTAGITRVIPIRFCYLSDSNKLRVRTTNVTSFDAEWRSVDFTDLASDAGFTLYKSMPALLDPNYSERDLTEAFRSGALELDATTGGFSFTDRRDVPEYASVKTWIYEDAASSFGLRQQLYALRGRQRSFWLPTFRPDFQVVQDVGSSDTQLVVAAVDYGRFVTRQEPFTDIIIQLKNGSNFLREITNYGTSGANETITISSTLGVAVTVADILRVSYLVRSRLGSDRIEIRHNRLGAVTVSIPVIGVIP